MTLQKGDIILYNDELLRVHKMGIRVCYCTRPDGTRVIVQLSQLTITATTIEAQ